MLHWFLSRTFNLVSPQFSPTPKLPLLFPAFPLAHFLPSLLAHFLRSRGCNHTQRINPSSLQQLKALEITPRLFWPTPVPIKLTRLSCHLMPPAREAFPAAPEAAPHFPSVEEPTPFPTPECVPLREVLPIPPTRSNPLRDQKSPSTGPQT